MSEFMDEAKKAASEHSDVADKGFDEAAQMADEKTGGKFDSQIQSGEQQAEGYLGVQDQGQGQQDQGQGQQDQNQGQQDQNQGS